MILFRKLISNCITMLNEFTGFQSSEFATLGSKVFLIFSHRASVLEYTNHRQLIRLERNTLFTVNSLGSKERIRENTLIKRIYMVIEL